MRSRGLPNMSYVCALGCSLVESIVAVWKPLKASLPAPYYWVDGGGHEGPNPPKGQNRVFALKCKELAAERTGARHQVGLPKLVPRGGETGNSCGAGGSRAGGCPHCRLRDNHTRPSPHTHSCPYYQPGLSPAQINLQGWSRGGGW